VDGETSTNAATASEATLLPSLLDSSPLYTDHTGVVIVRPSSPPTTSHQPHQ
jgi:hypothetical protein